MNSLAEEAVPQLNEFDEFENEQPGVVLGQAIWGRITGDIAKQLDLQAILFPLENPPPVDFANITGTVAVDQLPPGSVVTVDDIGQSGLYFFDEGTGMPRLIGSAEAAGFISTSLTFDQVGGTISLDQFPPGTIVSIDSIDADALYFWDNTLFVPRLIGQSDALTFLGITGGGSFLSNHTARVDPSGNDSTGTIGDLGKPFLTGQGAINAAQTASIAGLVLQFALPGGNETLTTSIPTITFIGLGGNYQLFNSLTLTDSGSISLCFINAWVGDISANCSSLTVIGYGCEINNVTNTGGNLSIDADTAQILCNGDLTASGTVNAYGLNYAGTISAGTAIHLAECLPIFTDNSGVYSALSINSPGSNVYATHCVIQDVTAAATLHLIDSRVIGTNNATSTVYADVLLLPRYQMSIDFDATAGLKLLNDSATPGNTKYYGTDSGGTKGYFALPGGGDASTNTSSSVDSEVTLFSGTGGKTLKRATGSGLAILTSGVLSTTSNNSSNWDTAFTERAQWNGGATNLVAATGRTSLGLVIGTNVEAWNANLDTLAGLTATTDNFIVSVTSSWASRTPAQVRTTLGLVIGTNVQAWDADLDALAALSGTNNIYYRSAANTWSSVTIGTGLSFSGGSLTATVGGTITLSGDVTGSGTTAITTTLANIPTAVTMAGYLAATAIVGPGTPSAGIGRIYVDSTSKNLAVKDDAGVIKHGVQTKASVASNFLTAISDAGLVSAAQPADSDISFTDITTGNASTSQHGYMLKYPGGTSTFLRADGSFATPGGGGTVTSIATTSPISGGTITGSGTLSLLVNVDHAFTAAQSITTAPAANTAGTGLLLTDTTAASSGNQQYSPSLIFTGQGWKTTATAASQEVDFRLYAVPVQGSANPSANLVIESNINLAGYTANQFTFSSGGKFLIGTQQLYASGNNLAYSSNASSNNEIFFTGGGGIALANSKGYRWTSSSTDAGGTPDTGLFRNTAGVVEINNGTAATYRDLKLRNVIATGTVTTYNNIATQGTGLPYIVGVGRVTAQSAANSNIITYTTPASDGSYEVSMNMNVTAVTALSTSLNCDYTDESNTARTMIFPVTGLTGSFLAGGLVTATGAFESPVMHIRTKASTTIKLYTAAGTFTSVTYTAEGIIKQMA